ncbi:MAG TPA: capsule biosynthesis protein, partial [Planctomycetota bacterium]|nr:capsule biosynthesis protein [Planctomycetota bacterium]
LTLRGAEVEVLICDAVLPACQACEARAWRKIERFARLGPRDGLCGGCFEPGRRLFEGLGIKVRRLGDSLTAEEVESARRAALETGLADIETHRLDGVAVGEHAMAGALRFFARGDLDGEPCAEPVLRRYLEAALLVTYAARRLFREGGYDCAAFHHGIYVPQGLVGEAARREGVRVVNWNPAYRKRCFIFSHGDSYHHTLLSEPSSAWDRMPWSAALEEDLLKYLESRSSGSEDWIWFHRNPCADIAPAAAGLGLDLSKPFVGLLTNVIWDAQLHYPARAFRSMMDWVRETIRRFRGRSDLQLVIRVHPAEVGGTVPSRQRVADELRRDFPELPGNVFVVPPESDVSTYALMSRANAALIYGTKMGVELAALGLPVIVAGEAWVRNKGFTHDAESAEHYFRLLDALPFAARMTPEAMRRARMYAYHFFFRRMIPIDCMEPTRSDPPYAIRLTGLDDLLPGRMPGLDVVLDGILHGAPFVYQAEEAANRGRTEAAALARGH